jgi:hypothetical protein
VRALCVRVDRRGQSRQLAAAGWQFRACGEQQSPHMTADLKLLVQQAVHWMAVNWWGFIEVDDTLGM